MVRAETTEQWQQTRLWFFCLIEVVAAHSLNPCLLLETLPTSLSQLFCFSWYFTNCLKTFSDKNVAKILSLTHKLLQALPDIVTGVWGLVLYLDLLLRSKSNVPQNNCHLLALLEGSLIWQMKTVTGDYPGSRIHRPAQFSFEFWLLFRHVYNGFLQRRLCQTWLQGNDAVLFF